MVTREDVQKVIDEMIAPGLRSHGGDIQLVDVVEPGTVKVKLRGACAGCPGAAATLRMGVERILRQRVQGIKEVVAL